MLSIQFNLFQTKYNRMVFDNNCHFIFVVIFYSTRDAQDPRDNVRL